MFLDCRVEYSETVDDNNNQDRDANLMIVILPVTTQAVENILVMVVYLF